MREFRETSPRLLARITGFFYLLNTLTILAAVFSFRGLFVSGDPAATATNVLAHKASFRLGFAFELVSTACSIVVTALFYELFKPVNRSVSLVAAFFRLIACAIAAFSYLFQLAPLHVLGSTHYLSTFNMEQLQALGLLLYTLHGQVFPISIVFFGFHFLLIAFLIFRSTFLPRILGVFVAFGGLGAMTFLVPPLGRYLFRYFVPIGLLAEVSLTIWLLVMG